MITEKCSNCSRYDTERNRQRNKLKCMFECEDYKREAANRAIEYNRTASGDDFDTREMCEHGAKVYGSRGIVK